MARPVLEEIVAERPDLKVSKINIDEGAELAGCFGMMSIPMLTVMKNGKIVTADSVEDGNIAVKDGKIAAILSPGEEPEAEKVIDAGGKYVFPGAIDTHAHLNDPGYEPVCAAVSRAAFCRVAGTMPTTSPAVSDIMARCLAKFGQVCGCIFHKAVQCIFLSHPI